MGNNIFNFDEFSLNEKKKVGKKKAEKSSKSDEDIYLSPGQKKLHDALKKGLISKYKKSGHKYGESKEEDDEKDSKKGKKANKD
jgi:hypothetical protein